MDVLRVSSWEEGRTFRFSPYQSSSPICQVCKLHELIYQTRASGRPQNLLRIYSYYLLLINILSQCILTIDDSRIAVLHLGVGIFHMLRTHMPRIQPPGYFLMSIITFSCATMNQIVDYYPTSLWGCVNVFYLFILATGLTVKILFS